MPITKEQLSKINRAKAWKRLSLMSKEQKEELKRKQAEGMREWWKKKKAEKALEAAKEGEAKE